MEWLFRFQQYGFVESLPNITFRAPMEQNVCTVGCDNVREEACTHLRVLRFYGKVLWGMFSMRDTDVVEGASITLWRTWGGERGVQISAPKSMMAWL